MQEPKHPSSEQVLFISDLLTLYKELPVLWDKNHTGYRNRTKRNEAHEALLQKCKEYHPEADEDFVKLKIDSLRGCFRKEYNKVRSSRESAERPEDIHKPNLWYYNLLLYTVGEECSDDEIKSEVMPRRLLWNREHTAALIHLYKKYPCLYASGMPNANLAKRNAAFKEITSELNASTGKVFTVDDIKKKIQLLKGQYRYEYKKIKDNNRRSNSKTLYQSNLWCYEMLGFLKGHVYKKEISSSKELKRNCKIKSDSSVNSNDEVSDIESIKEEDDDMDQFEARVFNNNVNRNSSMESIEDTNNSNYDDIFDTMAKNIAHKLRDMTNEQRRYAQKLVSEVMYYGQMEKLIESSRLSIDGT